MWLVLFLGPVQARELRLDVPEVLGDFLVVAVVFVVAVHRVRRYVAVKIVDKCTAGSP